MIELSYTEWGDLVTGEMGGAFRFALDNGYSFATPNDPLTAEDFNHVIDWLAKNFPDQYSIK